MKYFIISVFLIVVMVILFLVDGYMLLVLDNVMVYFIGLSDGDIVVLFVMVWFGLSGMGIVLVGQDMEGIGYYYLLINCLFLGEGEWGDEEWDYGLLVDDNYLYFGKGQIEVILDLDFGVYIL